MIKTRKEGTLEYIDPTPEERLKAIEGVVSGGSYCKIDGQMLDLTTANVILTIYRALSPDNQTKLLKFPMPKMATIVWNLYKRVNS